MTRILSHFGCWLLLVCICFGAPVHTCAQQTLTDLSAIDGVDITPDNILNYQVQLLDAKPADVFVKGVIQYRNSDLRIEYSFKTTLQPGLNSFSADKVSPQYQFSSGALRELFQTHKVLPFGTYQYCVIIALPNGENTLGGQGDCLYRKSEDQFMITLVDPENNAKLYEYYPQLSWVATYSFSSELTYRLRIAEIREGQNTAAALARNNPVYDERNLTQHSVVYPMYAKPLKAYQPYAWTVDAYYKGILLGGAEPWKFTIIEDSLLMASIPKNIAHLDIRLETGKSTVFAVGTLKLKYVLSDLKSDSLSLRLYLHGDPGSAIKLKPDVLNAKHGDNRYEIDFQGGQLLKHLKLYTLELNNGVGERFVVNFRYVNPEFLN